MEKIPSSVGILTFNSAATLRRALQSVQDFDDIVICDGGSTDETLDIAQEFGACIVIQDARYKNPDGKLVDFAGARNQCLEAAAHDWFLYVDSDETVSEGLREDIRRIAGGGEEALVYRVPIGILMDGRYLSYSSNYPGYQTRFFNKRSGARFIKAVHERITFDRAAVKVGTLAHPWYVHTTREEWNSYLADNARYRAIEIEHHRTLPWRNLLAVTLRRNLRTFAGVVLKSLWIYLRHGFSQSVPPRGELARALTPLLLVWGIAAAKLRGAPAAPRAGVQSLLYIANVRLPTEKAHGVQIMKMCEALVLAGVEVELVVPARRNALREDPFEYYGVPTRFPVTYLPVRDRIGWGRVGFWLMSVQFARRAARYAKTRRVDAVFSRDEVVLYAQPAHAPLIWESHTGAWNFFARAAARRSALLVAISQGLKDFYARRGVSPAKIVVAPDGVDLADFADPEPQEASRRRLGLPPDKKIALYVGRLDGWKGVETLCRAAELLPDVCVALIGGEPEQVETFKKKYPRAVFLGYRPYRELPDNQSAADVLVLPNTGENEISARFTSPLKLFSYLAAGKPIVASDLPSIREVLDQDSAVLVPPDNPEALARGIREALASPQLGARARQKAEGYTWRARASAVLRAIR